MAFQPSSSLESGIRCRNVKVVDIHRWMSVERQQVLTQINSDSSFYNGQTCTRKKHTKAYMTPSVVNKLQGYQKGRNDHKDQLKLYYRLFNSLYKIKH